MRDILLEYLKPREETLDVSGRKVIVRELQEDADRIGMQGAGEQEMVYRFVVRCVFDEEGQRIFTDDDLPAIKAAAASRLGPLMRAVIRVNALSVDEEEKNSDAAPSSG